ncbi:MAG TPA: hypothetical protein VMW23_03100 [Sedimentisphaerales bacterium]|nr:hypothetical protein [Sedimentisphaerales bacterium]
MSKKISILTLVLIGLTMNNTNAKDQILERKVLSSKMFNCSDLHSINLFIDDDSNIFVAIAVYGENRYGNYFLCTNNNWQVIDKYGICLNGFIKDGQLYLAFRKDEDVDIYNIQKDIKFVSRIKVKPIKIKGIAHNIISYQSRVIPVSDGDSSYYYLGRYVKFPANPLDLAEHFLSGGHGITYRKPALAEIRDNQMLEPRKLRYGGKIDETFTIKEAIKGKDSIHFLGFRGPVEPRSAPGFAWNKPVILHYADYDLKKKKTTRKHSIYENTPRTDKNTDTHFGYGSLSIDNLNDDIFVVFSWVTISNYGSRDDNIKDIKPDVYYWQYSGDSFGDIEKIGNGFMPLVKVDSLGNVHVLWIDHDGNLVCKTKKDDKWGKDNFIMTGIDILPGIISTRYICAEFDKDNNLHVVFPSNGSLVHAKVKLDVTADKQN